MYKIYKSVLEIRTPESGVGWTDLCTKLPVVKMDIKPDQVRRKRQSFFEDDDDVQTGILAFTLLHIVATCCKIVGDLLAWLHGYLDAHGFAAGNEVRMVDRVLGCHAPVEDADDRLRDVGRDRVAAGP